MACGPIVGPRCSSALYGKCGLYRRHNNTNNAHDYDKYIGVLDKNPMFQCKDLERGHLVQYTGNNAYDIMKMVIQ